MNEKFLSLRLDMDLSIINSIAIFFIILAIIFNMTVSALTYKELQQQRIASRSMALKNKATLKDIAKDIERNVLEKLERHTSNILDLDEFSNLDPDVKTLYKKHIVDNLMPALMDAINNDYRQSPSKTSVINEKELVSFITLLASNLRQNGLRIFPDAVNDSVKN